MGIGVSIFLIASARSLLSPSTSRLRLDIAVVGYILMIVGLIGLIMTAFIWGPRNRARGDVVEERRVYDDRV